MGHGKQVKEKKNSQNLINHTLNNMYGGHWTVQ